MLPWRSTLTSLPPTPPIGGFWRLWVLPAPQGLQAPPELQALLVLQELLAQPVLLVRQDQLAPQALLVPPDPQGLQDHRVPKAHQVNYGSLVLVPPLVL